MSLFYIVIRIFPFVGIALAWLMFDLALNQRRRGQKLWLITSFMMVVTIFATLAWLVFRGDLHAEAWYGAVIKFFAPPKF